MIDRFDRFDFPRKKTSTVGDRDGRPAQSALVTMNLWQVVRFVVRGSMFRGGLYGACPNQLRVSAAAAVNNDDDDAQFRYLYRAKAWLTEVVYYWNWKRFLARCLRSRSNTSAMTLFFEFRSSSFHLLK